MNQIDLFAGTLPARPYCTDQLGNMEIRQRALAIGKKYIQHNTPWDLRWMVYDVDRPTAAIDWQDRNVAAPNIVVMNRENGHAHLIYGLAVPVHREYNTRQHPLRYAASVDVAMIGSLEADPGYAGLLCKNPLHKSWLVQTYQGEAYELDWLADYLDLQQYTDARTNLPAIGLGRNCTLFDNLRTWAYRAIRQTWNDLPGVWSYDSWFASVLTKAVYYNHFETPLPFTEIKATAKSVAKYTWRNTTPESFREWGDKRRRKSLQVRQEKAQSRAQQAESLKAQGLTQKEIAVKLGIAQSQVSKLLMRATYGSIVDYL